MKQGPDPGVGIIPLPACKQPKGGLPDGVHIMWVVPCGAESRTNAIAKTSGIFGILRAHQGNKQTKQDTHARIR